MSRKYKTKKVEEMFREDYLSMQYELADLFDRIADEYLKGHTVYYEAVIDQILNCLEEVEASTSKELPSHGEESNQTHQLHKM